MNFSRNSSDEVSPRPSFDFPLARSFMSTEQQVFRFIIVCVGFILDSLIVIVILSFRQLHYPRHMFWLIISLVSQFYLVLCIAEIGAIVYRNQIACQFYALNAGVTYSMLLLCLFAAAFDRYVAIARPEWYNKKVTNKLVLAVLSAMLVLTYAGVTSPYWTGHKNISDCTINMTHMHWVLVWDLLLGISCVVLHIKIFVKSRVLIRQYPHRLNQGFLVVQFQSKTADSRGIGSMCAEERDQLSPMQEAVRQQTAMDQQRIAFPFDTREPETNEINNATAPSLNFEEIGCFPTLRPRNNRLEILAALYMSMNTISFWICTFPSICNAIGIYWCTLFQADCSIFGKLHPYLINLFHLHVIYNPVMYMSSSLEFRRALKRLVQKLISCTSQTLSSTRIEGNVERCATPTYRSSF